MRSLFAKRLFYKTWLNHCTPVGDTNDSIGHTLIKYCISSKTKYCKMHRLAVATLTSMITGYCSGLQSASSFWWVWRLCPWFWGSPMPERMLPPPLTGTKYLKMTNSQWSDAIDSSRSSPAQPGIWRAVDSRTPLGGGYAPLQTNSLGIWANVSIRNSS
jgi:hypothetical protein